MIRYLISQFVVDTSNIALVRAQLAAFTRQVPLLYFVLCANGLLCAVGVIGVAPDFLTLWCPLLLVAFCTVRTYVWTRSRTVPVSDEQASRRLKGVVKLGSAVGVLYLGWSLALYHHIDALARMHVTFSVAVTVTMSIACLMHLRAAVLTMATVFVVPYVLFLLATREGFPMIVGINLLLVTIAMVYVLLVASRDFDEMVRSRIETERLSAENAALANIDSLTALPNRRQFFDRLEAMLRLERPHHQPFAVGVLDIDGFKSVNDMFGHVTGDRMLIEASKRLETLASKGVLVARLGGDEFGVIVGDARDRHALITFGEQVCASFRKPFALPAVVANVSASIGFAVYPEAGAMPEHLYERADYALYFAKKHRRGQPVIFSDEHESEIRSDGAIEQCLRNADLDRELSLHFQPLFGVECHEPFSFEALARWNSPELGSVSPASFIAVAERTGLIHQLTHLLLRKALAAARSWPEPIRVSFNLSMRDVASPDSIAQIEAIVRESGVAPNRIEFEVTESALMGDFEQAKASIDSLRTLGARIALDDFGTGYSSLSHVHRLPLDRIKVDRSFISDIETRTASRDIIRSVLDLCQNLNIECVVEGTETAEQIEILRALGCRAMQGYFFARPMPLADVHAFLAACRARAAKVEPALVG